MRNPIAPPMSRDLWFGVGPAVALALVLIGGAAAFAALPEAIRLVNAGAALTGWSLAHWGCPQPTESSPVVMCGLSRGLVPTP